jgi:hypothetical protein
MESPEKYCFRRRRPVARGVATYVARNVQHVAVVSGYVGVFSIFAPDIGGSNPTINVFRLAK